MGILDNIRLDFQVLSTGVPKILVILDTSVWGFIEDKPSIIEITPPGTEKTRTYNFVKGKSNVFNSSNLFTSPVGEYRDLEDGIYRITVKGSPDSNCLHRDFLKTDKARLELNKIYIDLGFDNDKEDQDRKQTIQNINMLIRAAEASVSRGKLKKGMSYFRTAVQDLNNYNECETCN